MMNNDDVILQLTEQCLELSESLQFQVLLGIATVAERTGRSKFSRAFLDEARAWPESSMNCEAIEKASMLLIEQISDGMTAAVRSAHEAVLDCMFLLAHLEAGRSGTPVPSLFDDFGSPSDLVFGAVTYHVTSSPKSPARLQMLIGDLAAGSGGRAIDRFIARQ